jgi:mRNA-degrading endonuclease toxin of MazEF toxin-antitoxin module
MSESTVARGDVWWVSLDPAQGAEIKKTRPCVVLTHDTPNKLEAMTPHDLAAISRAISTSLEIR